MTSVLGVACARGTVTEFGHPVGETPDGAPVLIPVRVIVGSKPGPTVSLFGAVHGDEFTGPAAIGVATSAIDPQELAGTVIAVPVGNPLGLRAGSRTTPVEHDALNLNRVFPGRADGSVTERLAAALFDVIKGAACHMDFHDGGRDFLARYLIVASTGADSLSRANLDLAAAFGQGIPVLVWGQAEVKRSARHTNTVAANQLGIPAVVAELGGGGTVARASRAEAVEGLWNVLGHMGMIARSQPNSPKAVLSHSSIWPAVSHGGLWDQDVVLGEVVGPGTPLGLVRDVFGRVSETVEAPWRGVVLNVRHTTRVMTGDMTVHLGKVDGGEDG
jgi:predicted deacylase